MARTSLKVKAKKPAKFSTRAYTRCELCGRARAVYRKFKLCRLCFRKLANEGKLPGVMKSSW
ncbi:30S ribosomal protein S14 type Z [Planctomycetales bacterium]|jgi:small subunit ribosomal protein S14|nr:type Z 30S ribosomal protein S14 [Planctomycetota bacterium]GHS92201.1 30S ribosomal protein S14 type Z [Planctomycetales bacterium]GHS99760.1 30S ribosomal protein S14 type Z [Planctomycetales bacterium]GHT07243.1 30S ribosomal protein S14 type Z [Planctomycetales bacterium]GHV18529.1 30S ribosomal protein S14 type Z [Planctomycetales bacterium]